MALNKKTTLIPLPEPTLEQRHAAQTRRAEAALGVFNHAAVELEIAADELDKVAVEALAIVEQHQAIVDSADEAAAVNRRNATKIRDLFA